MCNKTYISLYGDPFPPLQNYLSVIALKNSKLFLLRTYGKGGAQKSLLLSHKLVKMHAYKLHRQEFGEATKMPYTKHLSTLKQKLKRKANPHVLEITCEPST